MKYFEPERVRERIDFILNPASPPNHQEEGWTVTDRLLRMCDAMTETAYSAGRLEVQNGVVDALGLRHLLTDGR